MINDLGIGRPELGAQQKLDDRSDSLDELRGNHLGGIHKQVQAKEDSLSIDDTRTRKLAHLPLSLQK